MRGVGSPKIPYTSCIPKGTLPPKSFRRVNLQAWLLCTPRCHPRERLPQPTGAARRRWLPIDARPTLRKSCTRWPRSGLVWHGDVDGCPAGWFYFALDATGEYCYGIVEDLHAITHRANRRDRVLVEIPIGLRDGPRCCDLLARRRLGRRRFSVFPAPARAALEAVRYDDACRRNQEATGKKLSR